MTIKEAGQTARSALSVFKREPLTLALVIINVALIGLLYWERTVAERERGSMLALQGKEMELLYENRKYVGDLLSKCYPAPPSGQGR